MKNKLVNLFYVLPQKFADCSAFFVMHRQITGRDRVQAKFYFGSPITLTKQMAGTGAKNLASTLNKKYPEKVDPSLFNN